MTIWKHGVSLEEINQSCRPDTMLGALGICFTAIGDDFLEASMPVRDSVKQPFGLLHGGASCALAESVGSVASILVVGDAEKECFGIEINANHVRAVKEGSVIARATPVHLGGSLHVWDIRISDAEKRLACVSRLTVMVRSRPPVKAGH